MKFVRSQRRRRGDQKPAHHHQTDRQFAEHADEITEQCSPARASGADQTLPCHEFSPAIAPTTGPTINPGKGKKSPTIAPSVAPKIPHFVAPNRFAPK